MNDDKNNKGIIEKLWDLLSSIKLAVVVFSIISLTSIVGTVLEQQAQPEQNIKLLSKFVGRHFAPAVFHFLDTLGFTDMFRSWWFLALLFVFVANLVVCSIDRLPKILKMVREPIGPITPAQLNVMPAKKEFILKGQTAGAVKHAMDVLKKYGFRAAQQQDDGTVQLYAEKGRFSRLGVYVTHLSILLILTGAVIGMLFGFNASLELQEGASSDVAYKSSGVPVPLGFQVRCDYFNADFYENTDTPKAYRSRLSILENGSEIMRKEIDVNSPLRFRGISFYQASYGYAPGKDAIFEFTVTSNAGKREEVRIKFGGSFTIPGTQVSGKVLDFSPALGVDENGKLFTYAEMMNNPAVFVEFSEHGSMKYRQWILLRFPQTWKVADGTVDFTHLWGAQYTGLQVRKDPGVWIVYLGCLVMAVGLYASFFMSHARVWVQVKEEKGGPRVVIAATVNKNKLSFERKVDEIAKKMAND